MRNAMRGAVALGCLLGFASIGTASTIQITSGSLTTTSVFQLLSLSVSNGDSTFQAATSVNAFSHPFAPESCFPCPAGSILGVTTPQWSYDEVSGGVTVNGTGYGVGSIDGPALFLDFTGGNFTLPVFPDVPAPVTLALPFEFTGTFLIRDHGVPGTSYALAGGGIASFVFDPFPSTSGQLWRFSSASYTFTDANAVPEPASGALLLSGLVGLMRRRHRPQRAQRLQEVRSPLR